MKHRVAFTLVELLVVIGILSMLLTIMLPNLGSVREWARRTSCMANLAAIGGAILEYDAEHLAYPATANDTTRSNTGDWVAPDGDNVASDEEQAAYALFNTTGGSKRLSPSASMFLLVRGGSLEPGAFVCPSDKKGREYKLPAGTLRARMTDFGSIINVSYCVSYLWNYVDETTSTNSVEWPKPMPSDFALMSDLSPVVVSSGPDILTDEKEGNSWNHRQDGQNVLYADKHIKWWGNNRAGAGGDNIFVPSSGTVPITRSGAKPDGASDTVMCFYDR
jgi:type II secretory pathway pseudopilin PulG